MIVTHTRTHTRVASRHVSLALAPPSLSGSAIIVLPHLVTMTDIYFIKFFQIIIERFFVSAEYKPCDSLTFDAAVFEVLNLRVR